MHRLTHGLGELTPDLRLLASAFWVAWITAIYSGDGLVVPATDPLSTTSITFLVSTLALAGILLCSAVFARRSEELVRADSIIWLAGILAALSTVGISFEGALPVPLFMICAAASGIFTGVLAMRCACIFSELDDKRNLVMSCISLLAGILLYAFTTMTAFYFSPAVTLAVIACFPMLCALLATIPATDEKPLSDDASLTLAPSFWRIVAFCGILVFALSVTRGYYPQLIDSQSFSASRGVVAIGLILSALIIALIATAIPRKVAFGRFYYWLLLTPVIAIVPIAALGVQSPVAGALGGVTNGIVSVAAWCVFTGISYHSGMSVVRTFGFGYGVVAIGLALGVSAGGVFGALVAEQYMLVSGTAFLAVCALLAAFILRMGDLDAFAQPTAAMLSTIETSTSKEDMPQSPNTEPHQLGRFQQRCAAIAASYGLSPRETEVFLLLAKHMEAKAIADELYVSFNTARTHISKVYTKLDVHSRRELLELVDSYKI